MTSAFVLDITNAHLWDKGLYEGIARVVADTFTGALYGMSGGLLAGGGTAAAMKGGRVIASVGASAEDGLGSVTSMRERTQPHPEAARITEALHDALPMHIREEMLAAVDVHVLESGPEADAFLATTGSHSGEACIWTDGEQIVVFARPDATVEDIAHEAGHLEQLFSASKGPLVRELYDAVPDLATWEALGEAGLYAEQLRLYKLKLGLEIDLHETQRAARQAAGDVEGVLEAEQTLAELRGLQQRAEAVTAEELAAGPVKLLEGAPPWLFTGEGAGAASASTAVKGPGKAAGSSGLASEQGETLASKGGVGQGGEVGVSEGAATFTDPAERALADYLEGLGRTVSKNPSEGVPGAGRQGDAFVDGVLHEFKALDPGAGSGTVKNVVNNSIRDGGQAREIVIDARGSGLSRAAAESGAGRALGISRGQLDGLTILGDDYFFRWTPR